MNVFIATLGTETNTFCPFPTGYRTFGPFTVPSEGTMGWHYGTDRWPASAFFRFELTGHRVIT